VPARQLRPAPDGSVLEPGVSAAALTASAAAEALLEQLTATHGPLLVFQSGGCCDGSTPIVVGADELPTAPNDLLVGLVAGTPVYIDRDQHRRWGSPTIHLDVRDGAPEGMSLGLHDSHLVARAPAGPPRPGP
jgi:uncharacterized protein (DUF779 family)